jgi:hypothetical protein
VSSRMSGLQTMSSFCHNRIEKRLV